MNRPPQKFLRIGAASLSDFSRRCLCRAGMRAAEAAQLAQLLVDSDLRGVVSHGTRALPGYCRSLSRGQVNPRPQIVLLQETETSVFLDGDGGLGYAPTMQVTERCIAKARKNGVAVGAVRGIGHFGAAGHYVRRALAENLIGFCVQGAHPQYYRSNADRRAATYGNPPLCFGVPAPPGAAHLVLDGATCILGDHQRGEPFEQLESLIPAAFFKSMGYTAIATLLGGAFVGQAGEGSAQIESRWPAARLGSLVWLIDAGLFAPLTEVKQAVADMARLAAEEMIPVTGYDEVLLPGGVEHRLERAYRAQGVKIDIAQAQSLRDLGREWDVEVPWETKKDAQ